MHKDPNIKGASLEAEEAFKNQFPAIYNHLLNFKTELSNRNQTETGVRYEWYALQRWGANYMDDFYRQKIIYPNMTKFLPFVYDLEGYYVNQKCFIITGKNIAFLTAFLNSKIFKFCYKDNFPELQGGTRELSKIFFEKIKVIEVNEDFNEKIFTLLNNSLSGKLDILNLDKILNDIIFSLYELNQEEREFIEN